jgi:hypothetical protein
MKRNLCLLLIIASFSTLTFAGQIARARKPRTSSVSAESNVTSSLSQVGESKFVSKTCAYNDTGATQTFRFEIVLETACNYQTLADLDFDVAAGEQFNLAVPFEIACRPILDVSVRSYVYRRTPQEDFFYGFSHAYIYLSY